jgi:hypothetical protein
MPTFIIQVPGHHGFGICQISPRSKAQNEHHSFLQRILQGKQTESNLKIEPVIIRPMRRPGVHTASVGCSHVCRDVALQIQAGIVCECVVIVIVIVCPTSEAERASSWLGLSSSL